MGSVPNLTITADQAQKAVALAARKQRTQRRLPAVAPSILQFAKQNQIYIFNVGPWDHDVMLGSWGTYHIPACEKGKPYAEAPPIPGIYHEPIPVNESNFQLEGIEGSYFADQVLGTGKNLAWNTSLVRLGVFRSNNPKPTDDEIMAAMELLSEEYHRLFEEAETAYAQGPKQFEEVVGNGVKHKLAARELGRTDAEWVKAKIAGKRKPCPNCGEYAEPQVISCSKCQYVFDVDRYNKEILPRLAATLSKRGPGRPPNEKD